MLKVARRQSDRFQTQWSSISNLERRLLLAGDVANACVDTVSDVAIVSPAELQVASTTSPSLVFIDGAVQDFELLADDVIGRADIVLLDAQSSAIDQITTVLADRKDIKAIHIVGHGESGRLILSGEIVDQTSLHSAQAQLRGWSSSLSADADILLYGCETGQGTEGQRLMKTLALLTGADVAASVDKTGHQSNHGNWILEAHVGSVEESVIFSGAVTEQWNHHLPITIRAAGVEGDEEMQLLIDGNVVQTWSGVGGDAYGNQFETFTFNANGISANQISIRFTNDLFDEVAGIDRNLRVDNVVVDGVTYETEASDVFSTGTWLPEDGVVAGFRQNEFLHTDGEFSYAQQSSSSSLISIVASGSTGQESMSLQIDGVTVQSYAVSTSSSVYTFDPGEAVSPERIRVAFTNDLVDEGTDRNLTVDRIQVGDTVYETEAPTVYSTGTWLPTDGIVAGFRQSEVLHANGYFQYGFSDPDPNPDPGTIVIQAAGSTGQESMLLQIDGVTVASYVVGGDPSTRSFQSFTYQHSSAVSGDQVRLVFDNDFLDPVTGEDRNLTIDRILIDGVTLETEAPTVFSTGTWLPGDGIQPGFRQSETLHADGYFQFDAQGLQPGFIGLFDTQVTVDEDSGNVQITVLRYEGSDGPAVAFYQTVEAQATSGADFVGTNDGRVDFADGQTTAIITIDLVNDNVLEAVETFSVSLYRADGAELGVPRTAIITIVDDEAGEDFVGHWRLDETTLGESVDSSGQGNNGVHNNFATGFGPSSDAPDVNSVNTGSFSFDGNDDFISVASDPSLDLSAGTFTQSVWIKPDHSDNGYHGVLGYQSAGGAQNRYPGIWVYQQDRIHAGFGDGTNWNSFITGNVLTPNQWNHVATTFDGTNYAAYVNGVQVFSTTDFAGRNPVNSSRVDIGRVDNYFSGNIDDVRIYNRALSATEVGVLIDGATVPDVPIQGEFVANSLVSGFDTPLGVDWLPDGRMLVAEQDGYIRVVNLDGSVQSTPLLDIANIVNSGTKDRGMLGFAVHPDFANNPYIYVSYTYDPPEVNGNSGLGGPDGNGARVARISRFTVNAAGTFADPNSNVVLVGNNSTYDNIGDPSIRPGLNDPHSCIDANGNPIEDCIPSDETSHTIGDLEFGPDGMLYISSGDGGSFGRVDPINLRALDLDSLAGKILRIDPITGQAPTDNPFFNGNPNSNQSKVYAYGLRNPFRIAINQTDGEVFIGDVGWTQWEEINTGRGANFGWPAFEGGNGVSLQTGRYRDLQVVQDYYATNPTVTAPAWARLHSDGARAIVMGDFVSDAYANQYADTLLFTDIGDQILRAATIDASGNITDVDVVSSGVGFIVDIQTGPDGLLYYVDITGSVGRLDFVVT